MPTIDINDLPPEVRKKIGARKRPTRSMTMHEVRTYAIRVLNVMADLTPNERKRILRHALKVNDV